MSLPNPSSQGKSIAVNKVNPGFVPKSNSGFSQIFLNIPATSLLITFAKQNKNLPMKFCTSQCKTEYEIFYHMLLQAPSLDCISIDSVDFQLLVNKKKMGRRHQP